MIEIKIFCVLENAVNPKHLKLPAIFESQQLLLVPGSLCDLSCLRVS